MESHMTTNRVVACWIGTVPSTTLLHRNWGWSKSISTPPSSYWSRKDSPFYWIHKVAWMRRCAGVTCYRDSCKFPRGWWIKARNRRWAVWRATLTPIILKIPLGPSAHRVGVLKRPCVVPVSLIGALMGPPPCGQCPSYSRGCQGQKESAPAWVLRPLYYSSTARWG